jgi:hypothetical protein
MGPVVWSHIIQIVFGMEFIQQKALFSVMGIGCQSVSRTFTEHTDVVSGIWNNGNTGVVYGLRTGMLVIK